MRLRDCVQGRLYNLLNSGAFVGSELLAVGRLALTTSFTSDVGRFYGMWSSLEACIDYTIGRLLKTSHTDTHILTAGMEFGRKANLLRALLARSDEPEKDRIRALLTKIQNESRRNIFTHSLMLSDSESVTFVHRKMDGTYTGKEVRFTGPEFKQHVDDITAFAMDLSQLLSINPADFQEFGRAASSAENKASKSPQPPSSGA
jgi:hypothetical protein